VNVEAPREVLSDPIGPQQFLAELLDGPAVQVENPMPGKWEVRGRRWGTRTPTIGTPPATDIAQAVMTGGACRRFGCPGWADIEDRGVRGLRTSATVVPGAVVV
jgi:hypothetical protein